ncbi:MAG: type I-E CRISPR-associated protein Cas7/Cse4/CasC [Gammaproteobacteria bacterium]
MSDKNYLNVHVLISHSPSCLNRDDMNMQKSAIFGGVRRVRVSSQSLKRAMRRSDYYREHIGLPTDRTRELGLLKQKYVQALADQYPEDIVVKVISYLAFDNDQNIDDKTRAGAVAPWTVHEVAYLCGLLETNSDLDRKKLEKLLEKESAPLRAALAKTPDIAFSGRMATSGLMASIDGALSLAHAITTHAVDADIDWFTAVDDLTAESGETGSGHLDTQEFSAGVFYRYASLNLRQLQENMGDITRQEALAIAQHLVQLLATVVPDAKQHSFAAYNPADFVLASLSDMPISGANAFEKPICNDKKSGFLEPSIKAFQNYWQDTYEGYGLNDRYAAYCRKETAINPCFTALPDLKNWVANDGQEQ